MRHALGTLAAVVALLGLLVVAPDVMGAFVELSSSTILNAHASAGFTGQAGLLAPEVDDDFGDLADPQAAAQASASLPVSGDVAAAVASGTADARISRLSADLFELTGGVTAGVDGAPAPPPPINAEVESVARLAVPFTVATGGRANLAYDVDIEAMVQNNEKVTIELARVGAAATDFIFRDVFNDDATGTIGFLQPGGYNLLLIAGAEATNQGVADEHGRAAFTVTLSAEPVVSTSIPLPAGLVAGLVMLSGVAAMAQRRRLVRA